MTVREVTGFSSPDFAAISLPRYAENQKKKDKIHWMLEAQQRYFSYRAIHVAIVSQNSFVLVLWASHNYSAICCKMGYCTDMSGIKSMTKGGIAPFWGATNLP